MPIASRLTRRLAVLICVGQIARPALSSPLDALNRDAKCDVVQATMRPVFSRILAVHSPRR